ncbi:MULTISPECIES: ATP-binding cassette domain-containing protein [Lactococcus]|uniref:Putative ABC transporter ATP-binding protein YxlF n=1 Tax=Lactococcus lactis TaxID=1358 RepID=A0A2X0PFC5_9LACT|nr:ABC transporter ATP-binding protein [Lactococcus lactis]MCH5431020.1 ABC transporter ATP-binding protein [Lactococcus lactis]MDM7645227.1 ABC transporter ATP-binding protein [Lactococcus lactis]RQE25876.1 ABC transporter ATP-binding protein [Lactococcus lactis]SPS10942.1 putative ABC transporter ATP-binding protein YxlF [Lactococcus lactis]
MYIKNIIHNYPEFRLNIKDINLENNRIIGLIGENGAGKTTLMNILSGLQNANELFNCEESDSDNILYVPSNIEPFDYMSVMEFVDIIRKYSKSKKSNSEILQDLELEDKKDTMVNSLSQGMKKKLTLINVFLYDYSLVILDEPFNSVDVKYIYQLKKMLIELKKRTTILISSHILDTLNDICDNFVYLKNGEVIKTFSNNHDITVLERELFD